MSDTIERAYDEGYTAGVAAERARIREAVEGQRQRVPKSLKWSEISQQAVINYNQAIDGVLAIIVEEGTTNE